MPLWFWMYNSSTLNDLKNVQQSYTHVYTTCIYAQIESDGNPDRVTTWDYNWDPTI